MSDPTKLTTAELCDSLQLIAAALKHTHWNHEVLNEAARRLDALRWRDAGDPPDHEEWVWVAHRDRFGKVYYCQAFHDQNGWIAMDIKMEEQESLSWLAWRELPTYEPEREVRG